MKKNVVILYATALVLILSAFTVISAEEPKQFKAEKSVAWYVANIQEAKAQNQQCHNNPSLRSTEECTNALHALEISFNGGN